jgi:ABC-type transporter Mla subunit MlaD
MILASLAFTYGPAGIEVGNFLNLLGALDRDRHRLQPDRRSAMRRIAALSAVLAIVAAVAALIVGSSAQGSSAARFDVIFDNARGLIGGQLVKIAGAKAGTVTNVVVTPDFKARIEATVASRFFPFHKDATCTIRPEG